MSKSTKFIAIALATVLMGSTISANITKIHAAEKDNQPEKLVEPIEFVDSLTFNANQIKATPESRRSWINLGTITLDPTYVNNANKIQSAFTKTFIKLVGFCIGSPLSNSLANAIARQITAGKTTFYTRITQYASTDYEWRKFTYSIYQDAKCTKLVGTGEHPEWKLRYSSRELEALLDSENMNDEHLQQQLFADGLKELNE